MYIMIIRSSFVHAFSYIAFHMCVQVLAYQLADLGFNSIYILDSSYSKLSLMLLLMRVRFNTSSCACIYMLRVYIPTCEYLTVYCIHHQTRV